MIEVRRVNTLTTGGRRKEGRKADFEYSSGLFVDQARDTFDSSTTGQSSDGRLSDTLDVVAQDLTVTWGERGMDAQWLCTGVGGQRGEWRSR